MNTENQPPANMKYRKKPVVIEAFQWTNKPPFPAGFEKLHPIARITDEKLEIETLEGKITASDGDWIIKACKPDIFAKIYEPQDDTENQPPAQKSDDQSICHNCGKPKGGHVDICLDCRKEQPQPNAGEWKIERSGDGFSIYDSFNMWICNCCNEATAKQIVEAVKFYNVPYALIVKKNRALTKERDEAREYEKKASDHAQQCRDEANDLRENKAQLSADVKRLESERDEAQKLLNATMRRRATNPQMDSSHVCEVELLSAKETIAQQADEITAFREFVSRACHTPQCQSFPNYSDQCTCGLDQLKAALKGEK